MLYACNNISTDSSSNRNPAPFIQNYKNWCWVVAVKLLVLQHVDPKPCLWDHFKTLQEHVIAPQDSLLGLRTEYAGYQNGLITVDKWQYKIATHINPDNINLHADDYQKIQAINWMLNNFTPSNKLSAKNLGYYLSSILWDNLNFISPVLEAGNYVIGNTVLQPDNKPHNFILAKHNEHILLYDPWDGFQTFLSRQQAFLTGFLCNMGQGVIRWVQYIE